MIGPVYLGEISPASLAYWDGLADALQNGGVDGFVEYIGREQSDRPGLARLGARLHPRPHAPAPPPEALVDALREVPRSRPFESVASSRALEIPALVVASHDAADPGHPYAVAAAYAERLPRARLISEGEGESPLAWQGGRLSREIASFYAEALSSSL